MGYEQELKTIYNQYPTETGNVLVANAKSYDIHDRRRITVACRVTPLPAKTVTGTINIYGSIIDVPSWYVLLGTITINTAVNKAYYFNVVNSVASGAALIYLRFELKDLAPETGYIDLKMFRSEI